MVGNAVHNGASQGVIADLLSGTSSPASIVAAVILASAIVLPLLNKLLSPRMNQLEPPLVKPTIPFIGHIIGIIRHQNGYHRIVHDANPSLDIATLPMLNGKMYTVFNPHLIQTILRSKVASFEPFVTEFAQKTFDLSAHTFAKVTSNPKVVPDFTDGIHSSFQTEMLHKMNVHFLTGISTKLGRVGGSVRTVDSMNAGKETLIERGLEVDNLYLWCRDIMTLATTRALYGDHDPYNEDPSLVELAWTFESSVPYFLLSLFPSLTMPKAYQARKRLQSITSAYYTAEHDLTDPTTSQLVINRANALRKHGFTGNEIGLLEAILPVVTTVNAIPAFYWILLYVLGRPELAARLREQVAAAAKITHNEDGSGRTVTFNIAEFDEHLPLLISCYWESMRLTNSSVSIRRIMSDHTVRGPDGREYLLKKGTDIQLSAGVTHNETSIWGDDASTFDPERFVPPPPPAKTKTPESLEAERNRKAAYFPFGGGRHLCPGRNMAYAEILGFMSVLLLGYEIEPVGMGFGDVEMDIPALATGTVKPKNRGVGLGAKVLRRRGWEDVQWRFEC
ncbi:hypothetical protein AK830_g6825 [Neonectria ditissima]|uniref:25-hydroxycholesterol 7-alpha-hydroxylase n=1 Tax=Neonectria ditissima TaxID=78410 RepID=A0A0P7BHI1_9HYPO|nr:hypothetical protein AK830_g6825 [Neonectria ditissima]